MRIATLIVCMLVLATAAIAKTPYTEYPAAGAMDRQGGDTIETAAFLGTLPFSGSGTTVGYNHDYDEVCPYDLPGALDVVYEFVACVDGMVSISLCAGSAYDTKLYVYKDAYTPGAPWACNDDACPGYVSELSAVYNAPFAVSAGSTYWVVVDGWSPGDEGFYTIDITGITCTTPTETSTFSNTKALYR